MSKYQITTKKGYRGLEVISALQKCIRRGEEREALYWAVELYDSGYAEWLWKRLRIISSEDVGMATPGISSEIWALYSMAALAAKNKEDKGEPQRLFMAHAVLILCRAKKSRLVDWALIWAWLTHPFSQKEIPDVALDKHTERGRLKKRSWHHFFTEGTKLSPHEIQELEDEYRELAKNAISVPSGADLFSE
jgi:replication-associated recombination protein RarA